MNGRRYSEPLRIVQADLGVVVRSLLVLEEVSPAPGALRGERFSNHQWMRMPVSVERASANAVSANTITDCLWFLY